MLKCNTCNGTYPDTTQTGVRYFHACPPIPNPAYQPDPTKPLFNLQPTVERPNKRDETLFTVDATTKVITPTMPGTGVTTV